MCQLLAINSTEAADVSESFSSFTRRGAPTNPHGWGMSYYDECRKLQTFLEPLCANACPVAQRLCLEKTVKTTNMLAHIRYATQGEVCLQNVHPFTREIVSCKFQVARTYCIVALFLVIDVPAVIRLVT
jgi:predicted glutamine amidotransferase